MAYSKKPENKLKKAVDTAIKKHGIVNDDIQAFLRLISDNTLNDKSDRDTKNELIRALFREGFEINDPSGTKKIGSKVIQQALWRVMSKLKFLDFQLHGVGRDESSERLTTEGLRTVAERGKLTSCFRDKGGVFQNACLYGDGFLFFGKGENDENPVEYRALRNEDVYADNFAFGVRGVRPANRMVVIFAFDKEEAYEMYPELKENEIFGRIPGTYQDQDRDMDREDNNILEIAWGYNLAKKCHRIFAGAQAYDLESYEGDEYPFIKNDKPFIPVFQFLCQPSEDGFFNYGIGDMVYDLAVITRKLLNMEVGHMEENTYPVTLINAPQSRVDELVEKMAMAHKARANGMKPFVAMEFDAGGGQVQSQSLLTQNLANEWSMVWDRLYREISRLGINLDDTDRGSGYTATQIYAEEESNNAFVKQMMEYNASETKELIECSLDAITEFVSSKNKTPLNLTTRITLPDQTTVKPKEQITMGMLKKEIIEGKYFVVVNSRTGAIPSDLMKITQIQQQLAITPPGTPEYAELYRRASYLRNIDMELVSQPVPTEGGSAPQSQAGGVVASETDRVQPNVRQAVPQPL